MRSRLPWLAASVVIVLVAATAPTPAAPAAAASPPTLTVTPSTGLVDGQVVEVSGTGWRPHARLLIVECDGDRDLCPASYLEDVPIDDAGAFSADYRVRSNGDRQGRGLLDCRTEPCFMHVTDDHDDVSVPLGFDLDTPPLPPPTVRITPDHDLVDGQQIAVEGSGYFPGQELVYGQCHSSDHLNPGFCWDGDVTADANGDISFTTAVRTTLHPDHGPIHDVSCHPDGCYLGIAVDLEWYNLASTRVALVPEGDEHVVVTPTSGLRDGDPVSIDATGLNADAVVQIAECVVGDVDYRNIPFGQCTAQPVNVSVDSAGEIHTSLRVQDRFTAWDDALPGSLDCRVDECQVIVGGDGVNYLPFEGADYSWLGDPLSFSAEAAPASPVAAGPRFTG